MVKKEYLDKIIRYIVDDTVVVQDNRTWYPPFPTPQKDPTHKIFYNLIPMAEMLGPKSLMNNVYVQNFLTYCMDTYGVTLEERELRDLWLKYLYTLRPKITGFTINESVDRKNEYLDKIVDFLVDDTIINYKRKSMVTPFTPPNYLLFLHHTISMLYHPIHGTSHNYSFFSKYCKNTYGLTDEEIEYIWKKYIDIIINKITSYNSKSINESVDRKNEYLDKVVNFLVDDTKLDDKQEELTLSLGSVGVKIIYFSDFLWTTAHFLHDIPSYFSNYIIDTYGLIDEEIRYVWEQYRYSIRNKILSIMKEKYGSNNINESVDRKSDYLDKIVNFLIDDTEYRIYTNRYDRSSTVDVDIWFPSTPDNGYTYKKHEIYEWSVDNEWNLDDGEDVDFICDTYSICDINTIQEIYNRYIQKLSSIIYDEMLEVESHNDSINESVDRRSDYLDKVVGYIMDDTIINYNTDIIIFPFSSIGPLGRPLPSFLSDILGLLPLVSHSFHNYCRETYGLTDDEMMDVWDKYSKILTSKLKDFPPL